MDLLVSGLHFAAGATQSLLFWVLGKGPSSTGICFSLTPGVWARDSDSAGSEQGAKGITCFFIVTAAAHIWHSVPTISKLLQKKQDVSKLQPHRAWQIKWELQTSISWLWLTPEGSDVAQ